MLLSFLACGTKYPQRRVADRSLCIGWKEKYENPTNNKVCGDRFAEMRGCFYQELMGAF